MQKTRILTDFLDTLDKDATEHSDVFTYELRQELVGILQEYMPTVHKYVGTMSPEDRVAELRQWILTMRTVEFKIEKLSKLVEMMDTILNTRNYSKSTKEKLIEKVGEVQKWLQTI